MSIRTNKDWTSTYGGFALVKQNQVTVLVNSAESKDKVDAAKAEQAFLAQEQLDKAGTKRKVEANFAFKRARTRYQLVILFLISKFYCIKGLITVKFHS
jgi:F0F1-type ATP synthase epsilon subunit